MKKVIFPKMFAAAIALALPVGAIAQTASTYAGTSGAGGSPAFSDPNTLFNALDDNHDNAVSRAEFLVIVTPPGTSGTSGTTAGGGVSSSTDAEKLFKNLDTNNDGKVSREEFQKWSSMSSGAGTPVGSESSSATDTSR